MAKVWMILGLAAACLMAGLAEGHGHEHTEAHHATRPAMCRVLSGAGAE